MAAAGLLLRPLRGKVGMRVKLLTASMLEYLLPPSVTVTALAALQTRPAPCALSQPSPHLFVNVVPQTQ